MHALAAGPHQGLFKLSELAPAGVRADGVTVQVAADPLCYGSWPGSGAPSTVTTTLRLCGAVRCSHR